MEMYIILKKSPEVKAYGVAFLGRVFETITDAESALNVFKKQHPDFYAKIITFDVDKEY